MKLTSYIKALSIVPQKSLLGGRNIENLIPISPKDQNDLSGIILPRVGANNWNPDIDMQYLQKIYDCHDLAYACIELISSTFALAKLKVKKLENGKWKYVPDHPLQRVLDNPNGTMTGYDLRQAYVVHRLLFGTMAFILLRDSQINDARTGINKCPNCNEKQLNCSHVLWYFNQGPVVRIMPINLELLGQKHFNTPTGKQKYFTYNLDGTEELAIHPDNLLTDPFYNPGGSFLGTSPTNQVKRWLEIDLGLSRQVSAYLTNNAIPSMIVNLRPPKDGGLYDEDMSTILEKMKEKWMRDFSMGGDGFNQGSKVKTPAFISGELEVHKIQDTLKDIVVKPLFYEIQNRIAMVYGVPPSFFEFGQEHGAQSTTIEQQEKNFYNRTICKHLESYKAKIERYVLRSYNDPTISLEWDLSSMGAAQFLEKERKSQVLKQWEAGLTTRDYTREQLGMDPMGGDLGDDLYRLSLTADPHGFNQNQPRSSEDNLFKPNPQLTADSGFDKNG